MKEPAPAGQKPGPGTGPSPCGAQGRSGGRRTRVRRAGARTVKRGRDASVRTFVAVELDPGLRRRLEARVRALRQPVEAAVGTVRWVAACQYHFTLRFLGELGVRQVELAAAALRQACGRTEPFELALDRLGAFPTLDRPRVLWVGVDESGRHGLTQLARCLDEELNARGFGPPERPFEPHLTLGRLKGPGRPGGRLDLQALGRPEFRELGRTRVQGAVLMESRLHPDGPVYRVMHQAELGRPGGDPVSQEGVHGP